MRGQQQWRDLEPEHREKCILCVQQFAGLKDRWLLSRAHRVFRSWSVQKLCFSKLWPERRSLAAVQPRDVEDKGVLEKLPLLFSPLTPRTLQSRVMARQSWAAVKQGVKLAKRGSNASGSSQRPSDREEGRTPVRPKSSLPFSPFTPNHASPLPAHHSGPSLLLPLVVRRWSPTAGPPRMAPFLRKRTT